MKLTINLRLELVMQRIVATVVILLTCTCLGCPKSNVSDDLYAVVSGNTKSVLDTLQLIQEGDVKTAEDILAIHVIFNLESLSSFDYRQMDEEQANEVRALAHTGLSLFEQKPYLITPTSRARIALRSLAILLPSAKDQKRINDLAASVNFVDDAGSYQ
jgi:hypothetical protein